MKKLQSKFKNGLFLQAHFAPNKTYTAKNNSSKYL